MLLLSLSSEHVVYQRLETLTAVWWAPRLMAGQVEMAMQAEEPALVLDMLIPMINFFNDFQFDLDDSKGAGAVFLQDWTVRIIAKTFNLLQISAS